VSGKAVTPFLLDAILQRTGCRSPSTKIARLKNSARLAAEIVRAMAADEVALTDGSACWPILTGAG